MKAKARIVGWKLWLARCAALVAAPAICLGLLELGLRLAGFGYPTAFLLPAAHQGREILIQNHQFGWRFFGRALSRAPYPIALSRLPAPETVRIFVLGESAAKGEPQPAFGLPRMLEAMLSLRHPGVRFEVVNAAMTAINSHAILPMARDCAAAGGDIWVIYMGNNEVVGPFGAGTVFGPQVPPLPLVRASIALKATRTGQWLDTLRQQAAESPAEPAEWRGMAMFLEQQVRADDPRMAGVYRHFQRNLADIIAAGRSGGAGIVVSTVAVNLRDSAPFASAHRGGLSAADKTVWEALYQRGVAAQSNGQTAAAANLFREAAHIDDRFAELRFRQGQCALAAGETAGAQRHFQEARDLDTLRFRCDSTLNAITRRTAAGRERVRLADAERAFAEASPAQSPGSAFFYEHAHLTFEGNYLLARTIGAEVEQLLAEGIRARTATNVPWPTAADCARRMAWGDWTLMAALKAIYVRLNEPPFTGQANRDAQVRAIRAQMERLPSPQERVNTARKVCEEALAAVPDDPVLHLQLAALREPRDPVGAVASVRRALDLLPSDPAAWSQLGALLARRQEHAAALAAIARAAELDPQDANIRVARAQLLVAAGRPEEAMREFRDALTQHPRSCSGWLRFGEALEQSGRANEAEECFGRALAVRHPTLTDRIELARFCQNRQKYEAAATHFAGAIALSPMDAALHVGAAQTLLALNRPAAAVEQSAEAVRLAPESAEVRLLHGGILGQQNRAAEAETQLREALRLAPGLLPARVKLGLALMLQGRAAEALEQFEAVLRQSPSNEQALRHAQTLRRQLGRPAGSK
ncbi:MAG: tetratricopeptide repeat protein [Verrucomicrobiota bacterium]